jgi:hypothetical protein
MRRTVAMLRDMARTNRLIIDRLVKTEKDNRRANIIRGAQDQYMAHINKLNKRICGDWMPRAVPAFADAIKGLKSIDSMREKVGNYLRDAMYQANEIADTIQSNRSIVTDEMFMVLVPDFSAVCAKSREDFANLLDARIAAHKEAEARREADRITREAAQADAQAKAQAAQDERDRQAQDLLRVGANAGADEAMINRFLLTLTDWPAEKEVLCEIIGKWEQYRKYQDKDGHERHATEIRGFDDMEDDLAF